MKDTYYFFFFNDTATTEIYTLSLHDALPILPAAVAYNQAIAEAATRYAVDPNLIRAVIRAESAFNPFAVSDAGDRKSTRLNSSHSQISYAVFCLKKKKISGSCRSCSRVLDPL